MRSTKRDKVDAAIECLEKLSKTLGDTCRSYIEKEEEANAGEFAKQLCELLRKALKKRLKMSQPPRRTLLIGQSLGLLQNQLLITQARKRLPNHHLVKR